MQMVRAAALQKCFHSNPSNSMATTCTRKLLTHTLVGKSFRVHNSLSAHSYKSSWCPWIYSKLRHMQRQPYLFQTNVDRAFNIRHWFTMGAEPGQSPAQCQLASSKTPTTLLIGSLVRPDIMFFSQHAFGQRYPIFNLF